MTLLGRRKVDVSTEKRIVTGMIVSRQFLHETVPFLKLDYFQNEYLKRVAGWVVQYYKDYETNPYRDIQTIFMKRQQTLSLEETELIVTLLEEISQRYQNQQINIEYLVDQAIEYFKTRELVIRNDNVSILLEKGDLAGAEKQFKEFERVQKLTSKWEDPFTVDSVKKVFKDREYFFKFPGQLGEFLGDLLRSWLVGITGPFKRGKTFLLLEFGIIGILSELKVAFFSLEMTNQQMFERIYKRITGTGSEDIIYPVFDCKLNQEDNCNKPERKNKIRLLDPNGHKPEWNPRMQYKPCSWCRENDPDLYEMEVWKEEIPRPDFEFSNVVKKVEAFKRVHKNSFRLMSYPRFSANVLDIERDLNLLERTEGFVPDIIIIDYADILKPEISGMSGVEKEDQTWMNLGRLSMERHCLLITATQATREALNAKNVNQTHTARWIGKLGHVDVMLSLNQTEEEKEEGKMRIGIMEHRHKFFLENRHVTILQKPDMGQVHLDSQI